MVSLNCGTSGGSELSFQGVLVAVAEAVPLWDIICLQEVDSFTNNVGELALPEGWCRFGIGQGLGQGLWH